MSNQNPKIISKNSYRYWGLLENIITAIVPITYIFFNYELYKKGNGKVTYWTWIIIVIILSFLKKFITNFILDLRKNQSEFAKRGTRIVVLIFTALILMFSYIWVKDMIMLLFVYSGGLLLSMYPYYHYTKNKAYYEQVKGISKDEEIKGKLKDGSIIVK